MPLAERVAGVRKDVLQIGYFGSYARDDWGVGRDLDLIVIDEVAGAVWQDCDAGGGVGLSEGESQTINKDWATR